MTQPYIRKALVIFQPLWRRSSFVEILPEPTAFSMPEVGGHGVFTADSDAVEEQGPCVANNPAVLCDAPACDEYDQTREHDDRIVDQAPASANPVTEDADEHCPTMIPQT